MLRLTFVVLLLVLSACAAPASSGSASQLASSTALPSTQPSVDVLPTASVSATPSQAADFAADEMVRAILPGISLRAAPGMTSERLGTLVEGSRSFVVSGPVQADGYEWFQLAGPGLPPGSGCLTLPGPELTCPVWFGWAAAGDPETDERWLVTDPTDCPDPAAETRAFMMLGDVEALHCYGGHDISFTGWIPGPKALREPGTCEVANDVPSAWLFCPTQPFLVVYANDVEAVSLDVYLDPASWPQAYPGNFPIILGHLDDPAARACGDAIPAGHPVVPAQVILECRTRFVVTLLGGVGP